MTKSNTPDPRLDPAFSWPHKQPDAGQWVWLHTLTWVLIYGGIVVFIMGLAAGGQSAVWGWSLGSLGAAATLAGVVLVVVRSRIAAKTATKTAAQQIASPPA